MGSSDHRVPSDLAPSADFLAAFDERVDPDGTMRFDTFVDLALYDPRLGYYRANRARVGYAEGTDFFTASTSGPVFGELVAAACASLLSPRDPAEHTFVEIGAETTGGILAGVAHPFAAVRTIPLGETVDLAGRLIVFSNELFDAQPFRRFRRIDGRWRELGVARRGSELVEIVRDGLEPPVEAELLPSAASDGYTFDAPVAAATLADILTRPAWTGLFVAFDYGKSWDELATACPAGTARAYHRHTQSNDLLARPGAQDLTCHVCWDWLQQALARRGFPARLETQETFFIRHAAKYLAPAIQADAAQFTRRKQSLLQLLHGAHLGHKFQVLHGLR